jgi:hypothetical protein
MKEVRGEPEDYRQLAARCAEIAGDCSEPIVAQALKGACVGLFEARRQAEQAQIIRVSRIYDRKTIASTTTSRTAIQASVKAPVRSSGIIRLA